MKILSIASLLLFCLLPVATVTASPPNIVLIVTDDMGWKDLHVQGNDKLRTPHLDMFASAGMRFTNAYAASPVCSPTRAALMTALAPARLKITQHGSDGQQFWPKDRNLQPPKTGTSLPPDTQTIADRLRARGYATGFFGKWHLGNKKENWPLEHGFDVNVGGCGFGGPPTYFDPYRIPTIEPRKEGEYLTDRLADEAIAWVRKQKKPLFLCLWTYNPHYPFEAPADLVEHYEGKEGSGLKNPIYGGQIEATDRAIGRVLTELERLEIADETLVIMTSDNGGWLGATDNRPLKQGKGFLYEGGLRVPLLIRWPGVVPAGKVNNTPVISMDLSATILAAAGVSPEEIKPLDGMSLLPLFDGQSLPQRSLFFHYPHWAFHKANRPGSAIRRGDHKLIYFYGADEVELYDLSTDLGETRDLSAAKPERTKAMRQELKHWLNEVDAGTPTAQ